MALAANRLLLDLLSAVSGKAVPVRALVGAAEVFGISENSLRVALARLVAEGKVERNERGQYELGAAAQPIQRRVSSWSRLTERATGWGGGWVGVYGGGARADRVVRRRSALALEFLGMRQLAPGLFVRPDNLRGGVAAVRGELCELGLAPGALVLGLAGLDDSADARARELWDVAAIERAYRDTTARLVKSDAALERLPLEQALVECFELGGRAIRQIAKDPILPEPILRTELRTALVEAMRRYDLSGRRIWRRFMAARGAPALQSLLTFRHLEGSA